jgi:hypothetical protein
MRAPGFSVFALATVLAAQSAATQGGMALGQAEVLNCTLPAIHGKMNSFLLELDEQDGTVAETVSSYTTKFRATFAPTSVIYRRFSATAEINRLSGVIKMTRVGKGVPKMTEGRCSVARPAAEPLLSQT